MNSSESSQPLRDPRQITFVMLNSFWSLSKNPSLSSILPILNGQHGMPTTSFEKVLLWKVIRYSYQFFIFFYFSRYHFYNFLEFHSALPEKDFPPKFSLFNGFTPFPQPHPLIGPLFSRLSWKCLMKYFFCKNLLTKSCKVFFKGCNDRFFGLLFKT